MVSYYIISLDSFIYINTKRFDEGCW